MSNSACLRQSSVLIGCLIVFNARVGLIDGATTGVSASPFGPDVIGELAHVTDTGRAE